MASRRLHAPHDFLEFSQVSEKGFKIAERSNDCLLLIVDFFFLLLQFFEHARIKITFFFSRLSDSPLFFSNNGLNGDFGLVMIFEVNFDFTVCCMEFDGVLFTPEESTFLK